MAQIKWNKPYSFTETYTGGDFTISKVPTYGGSYSYHLERRTPNPNLSYNHSNKHIGNYSTLEQAQKAASTFNRRGQMMSSASSRGSFPPSTKRGRTSSDKGNAKS